MSTAETPAQRLARNFSELLQELRVAQAGVQILFAFLLAVAFTEAYEEQPFGLRMLHLVTVLLATVSSALLIAPAVWHRVLFRQGRRVDILRRANLFALWGVGFLAAAMTGTVLLIAEVAVGGPVAIVIGVVAALMFATLWFVFPRLFDHDAGGKD
ncbi:MULTISPECIES: DUF6328 family protein [Rhodococcus]|uniref:Integral membrane protein n=1 Tax=Rhodococcus opacus RKJ300 = JCM 13270 TaxID=1165867 RepID=I0WD53_RHOOP|nr:MULTISPECIES: DUF6328 family protein [Rhodococcus]EID74319.1 hypothetical protein W59_31609 [Rhodococcus opacus RKJ300 = JCM 13270]QQZ15831.1 hypothetical protein GO592_06460 [Rhodococcus sp. 21391]GLK40186.1 hypothetical protein GCM10017611_70580 [Rhodococcus wratislaviensis]